MCGRYYVDDDTAGEIERIIRITEEKIGKVLPGEVNPQLGQSTHHSTSFILQTRDIHPTETAPVLIADKQSLCCQNLKWELTGFTKNQVIFNAKSESAMEKPTFREAITKRRIVIPAANASMEAIHDRMPLLLEEKEILFWIFDGNSTKEFLQKQPFFPFQKQILPIDIRTYVCYNKCTGGSNIVFTYVTQKVL